MASRQMQQLSSGGGASSHDRRRHWKEGLELMDILGLEVATQNKYSPVLLTSNCAVMVL